MITPLNKTDSRRAVASCRRRRMIMVGEGTTSFRPFSRSKRETYRKISCMPVPTSTVKTCIPVSPLGNNQFGIRAFPSSALSDEFDQDLSGYDGIEFTTQPVTPWLTRWATRRGEPAKSRRPRLDRVYFLSPFYSEVAYE